MTQPLHTWTFMHRNENTHPHKNLYPNVHSSFICKAKSWNQHRDPSTGECIPWNKTHIKGQQSLDSDSNLDESLGILMNKKVHPTVTHSMIPFM